MLTMVAFARGTSSFCGEPAREQVWGERTAGGSGLSVDVHNLQQTEDALATSDARLRALLEAAVDGIISIDERASSRRSTPLPSGCSAMPRRR